MELNSIKKGSGIVGMASLKILTAILLLVITGFSLQAQIKIYVMTDLEGVSGVYKFEKHAKRIRLLIYRHVNISWQILLR